MAPVIFGLPLLLGLGAWLVTGITDARKLPRATYRAAVQRPEILFLVLWIVAPLVIFSVSKSRLPLYVLPLVPAQALLAARLAVKAAGAERALRRTWRVAIVSALVLVGVKFAAAYVKSPSNMAPLAKEIRATHADRVTVVDNTRLFGLQFYLDGALHRTTSAELGSELDAGAGRLAGGASRSEVLLTGRSAPPLLSRRCGEAALACRVQASRDHQLWIFEGNAH
jgi:4-amino-4-deoxy-L-arabinose transferase